MIAAATGPLDSAWIDCGVAARAIPGEQESGDLHVIAPFADGVLLAVVDGLGHGAEAAIAARSAAAILAAHAGQHPVELVQLCHRELRKTRGAVLSLASLDRQRRALTWLGVGNVDGVVYRAGGAYPARESLVQRSGVVGYQIPPLRPATLPIGDGDVLVFATDGISGRFAQSPPTGASANEIAAGILTRHAKQTDDALVLVACLQGLGR